MYKNILLAIAIALALAITVVLVIATTKPDEFRVERSATLDAPVEAVFGLVNDFRRWPEWSPWEDRDPEMSREFSGATQGVGAVYAWDGNSDAGAGRMEIVESHRPTHVRIQLDFERPMRSSNTTSFEFEPRGERTHVNWTMQGANPFPFKIMQVFMDMDTLVGGDFERGLAQLEAAAAHEPVPAPVETPDEEADAEAVTAEE
jgi:uncharacterized protein YndB with AHSA1/START domain